MKWFILSGATNGRLIMVGKAIAGGEITQATCPLTKLKRTVHSLMLLNHGSRNFAANGNRINWRFVRTAAIPPIGMLRCP